MAAVSSSLSVLSAVSSPDSFRTAFQSPEDPVSMDATDVSEGQTYSTATQLPRDLKAHCQIYLEEHLYNGALGLLKGLLTSGYSRQDAAKKEVKVPPATHLALLNTLIIHPSHTTRAAGSDRLEVGSQTLDYLRSLLAIAGPINAGFKGAFQFWGGGHNRGRPRYVEEDEDEIDGDRISNKMAVEDSIWHRASDFWAVVGWAFNCSSAHPRRWPYWKTWLKLMLDVLEADLSERKWMDEHAAPSGQYPTYDHLGESMIVMYIKQKAYHNRQGLKMITQAMFADGDQHALTRFPEIFNNETKGLPSEDARRKRMAGLDIDNDQFGDYFDDDLVESETESQLGTPALQATPSGKSGEAISCDMAESIPLRLRLLELLFQIAKNRPQDYQSHRAFVDDVCRLLRENTPLPFFLKFVSDIGTHFSPEWKTDLLTHELDHLLPTSYKDPVSVASSEGGNIINAEVLELCYLRHHASTETLEDNVRLAVILESLLLELSPAEIKKTRDRLRTAAQAGVEARKRRTKRSVQKLKKAKSMNGQHEKDRFALETLDLVGERILSYIDIMGDVEEGSDDEMTD